jgi:hypothetical protein
VFVGLALPSRGLGPWYVRTHAFLGNALLSRGLASGIELSFRATEASLEKEPWSLPLIITTPAGVAISVPIDLRLLTFLPTACFVALAVATPLPTRHQSLRLLATGLAILQPLLWALSAIPIVSFLGGTGPVRVFELGVATHVVLQTAYRALVASPGMTYVIPLFLWWILVAKMTRASG